MFFSFQVAKTHVKLLNGWYNACSYLSHTLFGQLDTSNIFFGSQLFLKYWYFSILHHNDAHEYLRMWSFFFCLGEVESEGKMFTWKVLINAPKGVIMARIMLWNEMLCHSCQNRHVVRFARALLGFLSFSLFLQTFFTHFFCSAEEKNLMSTSHW